MFRMQR